MDLCECGIGAIWQETRPKIKLILKIEVSLMIIGSFDYLLPRLPRCFSFTKMAAVELSPHWSVLSQVAVLTPPTSSPPRALCS